MHVVYITYNGLTEPLGQSQVMPYVIGLTRKGYRFTIVSYEKPQKFAELGAEVRATLKAHHIRWKPLRYHQRFSLLATVYDLWIGFWLLLRYIPRHRVRAIHCRSYIPSILGLIFKKLYRTRFIFDMRAFWADERLESGALPKNRVYHFFKAMEKRFLINADAVIALTKSAIEEMQTWPYVSAAMHGKFHRITTCCDLERFQAVYEQRLARRRDESVLNLVYLGGISPLIAINELWDFLRLVHNHFPHARFNMLVGAGQDLLREFISRGKLQMDRFSIREVPYSEVPQALLDADIGFWFTPPVFAKKAVAPTRMGETLAAGIPIITGHSIGDVDAIITSNKIGYVTKDFSAAEFEAAVNFMTALLAEERTQVLQRCRAAAEEQFSLEQGIEQYYEIYKKLLPLS